MDDYICLDSKRYKTSAKNWGPKFDRATSIKRLFSGNRDVTFGPSGMTSWQGDIIAPVTSPGGDYGNIADLRALYAEDTTQPFEDHYGNNYNVVLVGSIAEKSALRMWDAASNEFLVPVTLVMVSVI